jgi:hypothetical protein
LGCGGRSFLGSERAIAFWGVEGDSFDAFRNGKGNKLRYNRTNKQIKTRKIDMITVEFKTTIENGMIKIPEQYQQQFKQPNIVKVTLQQETVEKTGNYLQYLLEHPLNIEDLTPMKREEIYENE